MSHLPRPHHGPRHRAGEAGGRAAQVTGQISIYYYRLGINIFPPDPQHFECFYEDPAVLHIEGDIDPGVDHRIHPGQGVARHVGLGEEISLDIICRHADIYPLGINLRKQFG